MRIASRLRCPGLVIGAAPPVESVRSCDQMTAVVIRTEATCEIAMLSSVLPNSRGFTRLTCSGVTTMRVGKNRLPRVQRLAVKVSPAATGWGDGEVGMFRMLQGQNDTRKELNHRGIESLNHFSSLQMIQSPMIQ